MASFQNSFGRGFSLPTHIVFFGGTGSSTEKILQEFPLLTPSRIRQTHSTIVVEACTPSVEADAHYTQKLHTALIIATADCIPLMIYCRQTHRVAAVHAGWKGVAGKIAQLTLRQLMTTGSTDCNFDFYIGPHIRQKSFEIDEDVFNVLAAAHPTTSPDLYSFKKEKKYFVNLELLVKLQIEAELKLKINIVTLEIDTKTAPDFYSYRRGKHSTERNLSFIALL